MKQIREGNDGGKKWKRSENCLKRNGPSPHPPTPPLVQIRGRGSEEFSQISKLARCKEESHAAGWLRWAGGLLCRTGRETSGVTGSCSEHHRGLQKRSGFWEEKVKKRKLVKEASDFSDMKYLALFLKV